LRFSGCTGWNIEVINFASSLEDDVSMHVVGGEDCFCKGFPTRTSDAMERMRLKKFDTVDVRPTLKQQEQQQKKPFLNSTITLGLD